MLNDFVVSVIRTVVPALVGGVVAWAAALGVDIDSAALASLLVGVLTGVYYVAARWLESRWPGLGWLLGYPKAPTYDLDA